jgi:transcriptional regulator with XRE-family HTH domain
MVKQKLINKRKFQKISQENMAFYMGITQSQYCRRENGITKISKTEWYKLAEILKTTLFEIYEFEDDIYSNSDIDSLFNDTYNEQLLDVETNTLTKHIQKLEIENKSLKEEVAQLQSVILLPKTK